MNRPWTIGVAFPKWFDVFGKIVAGAADYAGRNPQFRMVDLNYFHPENLPGRIEAMSRGAIDGLLLWMAPGDFQQVRLKLPANLPMVGLGHDMRALGLASATDDLSAAMDLLGQHWHDSGIGTLICLRGRQHRQAGDVESHCQQLARRLNVRLQVHHHPCSALSTNVNRDDRDALAPWLSELDKPAGVICLDPIGATWLVRACRQLRLSTPDEVAIISYFDDRTCLLSSPPITALQWPCEQFGEAMMVKMHAMLNGRRLPADRAIRPIGLTVRHSSGDLDPDRQAVRRAQRYIEEHACQAITAEQVYDRTQHISRSKFFHIFQAQTGRSPYQAIRTVRIRQACRYLATTTLSIARIATMCGYTEPRHFSAAFKKEVGQTPSSYRKHHRRRHSPLHPSPFFMTGPTGDDRRPADPQQTEP